LQRAVELSGDQAHFLFQRAQVRRDAGDLEGAVADYDAALKLDPAMTAVRYDRGVALKLLGDHAGAMRDAEELVERTPDDPQAWNMKGDL
ncbi:MAG: tetratricopeptide repeat protein, partial [Flavobacteriales bacterium]|nr:tetratricopeptide repeat protein [Flavobacteriales bacterium]